MAMSAHRRGGKPRLSAPPSLPMDKDADGGGGNDDGGYQQHRVADGRSTRVKRVRRRQDAIGLS